MPVSAARRRTNDAYNAKCDYISLRPLKPDGAAIRAAAAASGQSLQGDILKAVRARMIFCKPCAPGCRQRASRSPWAIRPARNP
jgi:hypothetical protein